MGWGPCQTACIKASPLLLAETLLRQLPPGGSTFKRLGLGALGQGCHRGLQHIQVPSPSKCRGLGYPQPLQSRAWLPLLPPSLVMKPRFVVRRLYAMGITPTKKSLAQLERLSVSSMCRRRLAVVLVKLKMSESIREAAALIEQGHVRVGPQTVTDPAFLVTRSMEDFVTWVDTSKIKRKVLQYQDKLDDYEVLQ